MSLIDPRKKTQIWIFIFILGLASLAVFSQEGEQQDEKARAIVDRAVNVLGGRTYLGVSTQIGRGKFSILRDGAVISFQSFYDVIVFPDKERTEFRSGRSRDVQTNFNGGGWVYDGDLDVIRDQTEIQLANFKRGMRVSLDNLLRGHWQDEAKLTYVGRRAYTLGRRNDVVKLTYDDGLVVEFEFADDGTPVKAIHKRTNADGEVIVEEDRYAQFVSVGGIRTPFIIDRFTNGVHTSRINYESVEYNKPVEGSYFAKPSDVKSLKRDFKL